MNNYIGIKTETNFLNDIISYFAGLHVLNYFRNKDSVTNKTISDIPENYIKKYIELYTSIQYPLCYIFDSIEDNFQYADSHIKSILNNPKSKIIKFSTRIPISKLKTIEPKTFKWLGEKPGSSFQEKLANTPKILSQSKKYSSNIKENQVTLKTVQIFKEKIDLKHKFIKDNPDVFGDSSLYSVDFDNKNRYFKTAKRYIIENFKDVISKDHTTPNNSLIGNKDYSVVWNVYRELKNTKFQSLVEICNISNLLSDILPKMIALHLYSVSSIDYVDKSFSMNDKKTHLFYMTEGKMLRIIKFIEGESEVIFDVFVYNLINNEYQLINHTDIIVEFYLNEIIEPNRGRGFSLVCNDQISNFTFDFLGLKESMIFISNLLDLDKDFKNESVQPKLFLDFLSLSQYSSAIYSSGMISNFIVKNDCIPHRANKNRLLFTKSLGYSSVSKLSIDGYTYLKVLNQNSYIQSQSKLIYDVKDVFDEFSSKVLRTTFSSCIPSSYPVWRSILAGESTKKRNQTRYILDTVGNETYLSNIELSKNRFIHYGPVEIPIYIETISEYDLYLEYIKSYQVKYDTVFSDELIDKLINLGFLNELFSTRSNEYYTFLEGDEDTFLPVAIHFDQELFSLVEKRYYEILESFMEEMERCNTDNTVIIVPDFIGLDKMHTNILQNKDLKIGALNINSYLSKGEICWYEVLPSLSLEVIKNGEYQTIELVKNNETTNIIGQKTKFEITQTMILKAGYKEYKLPLIKSFIGNENKKIYAYLKDDILPFQLDVEVKLSLEYQYGLENSYKLNFFPLKDSLINKKFDVSWIEDNNSNHIINPIIHDVIFTDDDRISNYYQLRKDVSEKSIFESIFRDGMIISRDSKITKIISRFANKLQRHYKFNKDEAKSIIDLCNSTRSVTLLENFLSKKIKLNVKDNGVYVQFLSAAEELHSVISPNFKQYLLNDKYHHPENCYGRIFASDTSDNEIIEHAFKRLIKLSRKGFSIANIDLREYLVRMTAATAVNHRAIYELAQSNLAFVVYLYEVIKKVIKELSNYTTEGIGKNVFYMGNLVDLLIAFLLLRDNPAFESLRPNQKDSDEIIFLLKRFNQNYNRYQNEYDKDLSNYKRAVFRSKYKMEIDNKPSDFNNVINPIYALIMFLSGDNQANMIRISQGEDNG